MGLFATQQIIGKLGTGHSIIRYSKTKLQLQQHNVKREDKATNSTELTLLKAQRQIASTECQSSRQHSVCKFGDVDVSVITNQATRTMIMAAN